MLSEAIKAPFVGFAEMEKNIGTKSLIAMILVLGGVGCVIYQIPLPDWMTNAVTMVVGLYFGASIQKSNGG